MTKQSMSEKQLVKPKANWQRVWESENGSVEDLMISNTVVTVEQVPSSRHLEDRVKRLRLTREKSNRMTRRNFVCHSHVKKVRLSSGTAKTGYRISEDVVAPIQVLHGNVEEHPDFTALHISADCAFNLTRLSETPVPETPRSVSESLIATCTRNSERNSEPWSVFKTFQRAKRSVLLHRRRRKWGSRLPPTEEPLIQREVRDAVVKLQGYSGTDLLQNLMSGTTTDFEFKGINFYKRIGRWTTHIWTKGKQFYIGSYAFASEAASAYDKASLKYFGADAQLNYKGHDYHRDIDEMAGLTSEMYRDLLRRRAKRSRDRIVEGVTVCPKGCFEVRIRDKAERKWQLLGRFKNYADANRCYMTNR